MSGAHPAHAGDRLNLLTADFSWWAFRSFSSSPALSMRLALFREIVQRRTGIHGAPPRQPRALIILHIRGCRSFHTFSASVTQKSATISGGGAKYPGIVRLS